MTGSERNRSSRRVTIAAIGISAAAHLAALMWLGLPIRAFDTPERAMSLISPVSEPLILSALELPAQPVVPAASAAAGGAGETGASADRPESGTPARRATPSASGAEPLIVAAADSLPVADVLPLTVNAPVAVAAAAADAPAQVGSPAPQPTAHVPGSAAAAKGRGAASSPGSGGIGVSSGKGGIGVTVGRPGTKRHPPPRGMPGRGRW
jgi:septal ring-binding cell division protein DamX